MAARRVGGRLWLPFTVRMVFYAGCDTVELVHSLIFDGDPDHDFIAGLGVKAHVLLHNGVHNRHVREVDVFHRGAWTGQGSRHNVVHWGCPCKEPRASQAGAKRFYHYLTGDERCRDLLDEVAARADQFKATNVPTEKYMARIGPTWAAWSANWMCAWERTGDARWRDKIVKGLEGILTAPHKLMQGDPFDYDPDTGEMRYSQEYPFPTNRLVLTMGGMEAWMQMADLLDHTGFREALAEFGAAYGVHPRDAAAVPPEVWKRTGLIWGYARLAAWAGRERGEASLGRRAWEIMLKGAEDAHERGTRPWPDMLRDAPPALSAEPWQDWSLVTNTAAMGSLNLIACLALAPEALEKVWEDLEQETGS